MSYKQWSTFWVGHSSICNIVTNYIGINKGPAISANELREKTFQPLIISYTGFYCYLQYFPNCPTIQKLMYKISKSFDFIAITLISSDFSDFIEITLIVKSCKCLHTTSDSDICSTCTCHVSLHECSCEEVWNQLGKAWSEASLWASPSGFHTFSRLTLGSTELVSHVLTIGVGIPGPTWASIYLALASKTDNNHMIIY